MGKKGKYETVSGADQMFQYDPSGYTAGAYGQLQNQANFAQNQLGQFGPAAMAYDPASAYNMFMGQAPAYQQLVSGALSGLDQQLADRTRRLTEQATQDVAAQFSGLGALHSSAARDTAAQRAQQAAADTAAQLGSQQINLTGNLWNQALGQNYQAAQFNPSMAGQLYGQNLGLLGQTGGQMAQFGTPVYGQEQRAYRPGTWERVGNFAGNVAGTALGTAFGG